MQHSPSLKQQNHMVRLPSFQEENVQVIKLFELTKKALTIGLN
jgi:hypothetical protein